MDIIWQNGKWDYELGLQVQANGCDAGGSCQVHQIRAAGLRASRLRDARGPRRSDVPTFPGTGRCRSDPPPDRRQVGLFRARNGNPNGSEGTSVATFRIRPDSGLDDQPAAFVPHAGPAHPHCVLLSPDNKFLLVAEKGQNRIVVYRFDASTGALTPNDPPFAES